MATITCRGDELNGPTGNSYFFLKFFGRTGLLLEAESTYCPNEPKMLVDLFTHLKRPLFMVGAGFAGGKITAMFFLKNVISRFHVYLRARKINLPLT